MLRCGDLLRLRRLDKAVVARLDILVVSWIFPEQLESPLSVAELCRDLKADRTSLHLTCCPWSQFLRRLGFAFRALDAIETCHLAIGLGSRIYR